MNPTPKKATSLMERMKTILKEQKRDSIPEKKPQMDVLNCPNCGAARAKADGITKCAYCNFEFLGHRISEGIHLKKMDNSD